jgi:hypothetical protein
MNNITSEPNQRTNKRQFCGTDKNSELIVKRAASCHFPQ